MFDNFMADDYHSWNLVYTDASTGSHIFIGDVQAAVDQDFLEGQRIKTVVTAAKDMDHLQYSEDISHIVYPLLDGKQEQIHSFFDQFFKIVEENLPRGSILVHCAAGISRSSTLVISYLMKKLHITFREAISNIRRARPSVLPNLGFERQLKKYEEQLQIPNGRASFAARKVKLRHLRAEDYGKSQLLMRTEVLPILAGQKTKEKLLSTHFRNLVQKMTEKDLQVMRAYNRSKDRNKKFMITKKSASFTKHYDDLKNLLTDPKDTQRNLSTQKQKRFAKTPIEEMKQIYLCKKNNGLLQRRFPTQRGRTFYNQNPNPTPHSKHKTTKNS